MEYDGIDLHRNPPVMEVEVERYLLDQTPFPSPTVYINIPVRSRRLFRQRHC